MAAVHGCHVVVASGADLAYLVVRAPSDLAGNAGVLAGNATDSAQDLAGTKLELAGTARLDHEIACVSIGAVGAEKAPFVAVGLWGDLSVRVLRLPTLDHVIKQELPQAQVVPRAVLLCDLEGVTYLFCGLGDGHLYTAVFDVARGETRDMRRVREGKLGEEGLKMG